MPPPRRRRRARCRHITKSTQTAFDRLRRWNTNQQEFSRVSSSLIEVMYLVMNCNDLGVFFIGYFYHIKNACYNISTTFKRLMKNKIYEKRFPQKHQH